MIKLISFAEILKEEQLLKQYERECSIPALGPINPQPEMYAQMENSGVMQCFGAFHIEQMVGFACLLTPVLPHYGKRVATLESIFVAKESRRFGIGIKLMRAIEVYAKQKGCVGVLYSAPAGGQLEQMLEANRHYQRTNAVFYRSLN